MLVLILWMLAVLPGIILFIFSLETLLGIVPVKPDKYLGPVPTTKILIPAHNEAATIETTLRQLEPILSEQVGLLVVSDNCSDATADLVRRAGHQVIERFDPAHQGKGFALAFGRDYLRTAPPQCLVIFDADCQTDRLSIETLARMCVSENRPVQAGYVFQPNLSAPAKVQISNFAIWIKNVVRQRGSSRLGAAAILVGTGMAFPWKVIEHAPLATSEIVEDLALGLHLTRTGAPPIYLDQAQVRSVAATEAATLDQRTRWEVGFVAIARRFALRSLVEGVHTRNRKLFQLGLHLLVPPLALLLVISTTMATMLGIVGLWAGHWQPSAALATMLALALCSVLINWALAGHRWLSAAALLRLPVYVLWKIPVYLRIFKGEEIAWKRTERMEQVSGEKGDGCK